jgi:D-lactate dehydrogenase
MGAARPDPVQESLPSVVIRVLERAGYRVIIPADVEELCCGMAFHSKGLFDEASRKLAELEAALLQASEGGTLPILYDTSPCHYHTRENLQADLNIYEPLAFIQQQLLSRLDITPTDETIAVHLTCSSRKLALEQTLGDVAGALAREIVAPADVGCCGHAGDRGFYYPELNASALQTLPGALPDAVQAGYSTSRTCEIGLSRYADRPYRSIFYLLDQTSHARTVAVAADSVNKE